jgi:hypothetical protein
MKELLAGLKDVGNEGRQMDALVELCEVHMHLHCSSSLTSLTFALGRCCPWGKRIFCWALMSTRSCRYAYPYLYSSDGG